MAVRNHLPDYGIAYSREDNMVTFNYLNASAVKDEDDNHGDLFGDSSAPDSIPPDLLDAARKVVGVGLDY